MQLFVQRAQAADPAFVLDDVTLPSVLEICARLDGQPLAIELAAARLRSLAVDHVAARLSDRFRLLTGGSRTALPRHRTLRAVVEWSWDLLDDDERDLAERIAVFPGGVTAASAAAVFDSSERTAELLESLADKSLLVAIRAATPRFRMLETLREYGTERLIDRGIVQKVRTAHVDYFLSYAQEHEPHLRGPRQLEAFAAFDLERGNISAALRFAIDQQDRDRAARMLSSSRLVLGDPQPGRRGAGLGHRGRRDPRTVGPDQRDRCAGAADRGGDGRREPAAHRRVRRRDPRALRHR